MRTEKLSGSAARRRDAVDLGLRRWRDLRRGQLRSRRAATAEAPTNEQILTALERRTPLQILRPETTAATPPLVQKARARASALATVARLAVWCYAGALFLFTTLPDLFRSKQAATTHRALQLRRTLDRMGGSFLKLGQQLSIRIDLLPLPYCQELSKLLDRVPDHPVTRGFMERLDTRNLGWHGNAILVRSDIKILEAHAIDLPRLDEGEMAEATEKVGNAD